MANVTIRNSSLTGNWYVSYGAFRDKKEYKTLDGCKRMTIKAGHTIALVVKPQPNKTRIVTNLMSGKLVRIPVDTPLCCDPSSETYWSM